MNFCRLLICSKSAFSKNYFMKTIRVSNTLDLDQARQNVGPDLGPNCLHRLLSDGSIRQIVNSACCQSLFILLMIFTNSLDPN